MLRIYHQPEPSAPSSKKAPAQILDPHGGRGGLCGRGGMQALVMIPDWKKAVDNALRLLRPGGHIGVCDFTVLPEEGQVR